MPLAITPISTITVSNSSTQNLYFTSIPQNYKSLIIYGYGPGIIGNYFMGDMQFNGSSSSYGYISLGTQTYSTTYRNTGSTDRITIDSNYIPWQGASKYGAFKATIFDYSNPNNSPSVHMVMGGLTGDTSGGIFVGRGTWYGGTGINSIRLFTTYQGANYFQPGVRFMLFGVA